MKLIKINKTLSKDKQKQFLDVIGKKLAKLGTNGSPEKSDTKVDESVPDETGQVDPDDLQVLDTNPKYPVAHSSIEIRYAEGRGR